MRRSLVVVTAALLTLAVTAPVFGAQNGANGKGVYLVVLHQPPAVAYEGGISSLRATKPQAGRKLNPNSGAVVNYVSYLRSQHNKILRAVGSNPSASKLYDYVYSLNGFAAKLSARQANRVAARSDVWFIERDTRRELHTENSPEFLGLPGGLWDDLGGQDEAGENVIIGVIDTGIWPEHPSFSGEGYGPPPAGWHGACMSGELFNQTDCNNKLIGARYFRRGQLASATIPDDYLSPRDRDGHGTHTASTAGGNAGVEASIFGVDRGEVSGIAPRARIAAYKVCWNDTGCFNSDIVSAIDSAIHDGVDVINYSIGGSSTAFLTSDGVAFLFADQAGVFVANSAGNDGPGASTLGNPGIVPWITTVAASTQDRTFQATATLGNNDAYFGASVTEAVGVTPLVDSEDVGLAGGDDPDTEANEVELCFAGTLDPAKVSGKIVLCLRGVNARVDKSLAVHLAGGAGMILYNPDDAQALVTDNHWVPSVHINNTDGLAIKEHIETAGAAATAQISEGAAVPDPAAPYMADFSSRGPNGGSGDVLKPDVTAPGVNILAGNSPTPWLGRAGELFQSISGTSMSSPHVAGVAALLVQAHPTWSPEAIKSSLMTTAYQDVEKEDKTTAADPFDFGGGHVEPNSAAEPGLVYLASFDDYRAFLKSQGLCNFCFGATQAPVVEPSNLNLASIAVADLVGTQTVTRTVTNVGPPGTYSVSVDEPAGFEVVVEPSTLALAAGESETFTVRFEREDDAVFDEWSFGSLTWSDGSHNVRSPIALEASILTAPATFTAPTPTNAAGTATWQVTVGYSGQLSADAYGADADSPTNQSVDQDPDQDIETGTFTSGVDLFDFALGAGDQYWAGGTFGATSEAESDLDVYLLFDTDADGNFDWDGSLDHEELVAFSADGDSEEIVELRHPEAGDYRLVVHGWFTPGGSSPYVLHEWLVNGAADTAGFNASVEGGDPATVVVGETYDVTLNWSGLAATATQYRGIVNYNGGSGVIGNTVVILNR